jgi:hypothetical protein
MEYFLVFDAAGKCSPTTLLLTAEAIHFNAGDYIVRLFHLYPILHICIRK